MKTWHIVIGTLVVVILGVAVGKNTLPENTDRANIEAVQAEILTVTDKDHTKRDSKNAKATLIEYSDFQCPACAAYAPLVKRLDQDFGDNLQIIYRHFPLQGIHPNAVLAAEASEAANLQNMFWEYHDLLFDKQAVWSNVSTRRARELFTEYAAELSLDTEAFERDLQSTAVKLRVERDIASASELRLNSTPTFFLNGVREEGIQSYEDFKTRIEEAMQEEGETTSTMLQIEDLSEGDLLPQNFTINGVAPSGGWFFEAVFPVTVTDQDGAVILETYAQADGEWMTESPVAFTVNGTLPEDMTATEGFVVFKHDNTAGLPQLDIQERIAVRFK